VATALSISNTVKQKTGHKQPPENPARRARSAFVPEQRPGKFTLDELFDASKGMAAAIRSLPNVHCAATHRPFAAQLVRCALRVLWRAKHLAVEETKCVRRRVEDKTALFARDNSGGQLAAFNNIGLGHDRPILLRTKTSRAAFARAGRRMRGDTNRTSTHCHHGDL